MKTLPVVVLCLLASAPPAQARPPSTPTTTSVTVSEGTNLAVTVSPRDGTLVFDLQGKLFSLPPTGGAATPIADDFLDPFWPSFSPDGSRIAVQSFADGTFHLRTLGADGRDVRQVTKGEYDDLYPAWSPDGKFLAFASDREGTSDIWTVDVASGALRRVTTAAGQESQPTWAPDGRSIAYTQGNTVESVSLADGAVSVLVPASAGFLTAPSWSPDGKRLAFVRTTQNGRVLQVSEGSAVRSVGTYTDVFPFPPRWASADEIVYGANGKIVVSKAADGASRTVPFSATLTLERDQYPPKEHDFDAGKPQQVRGVVAPALSPDGKTVVFKALNDIWTMPVGGLPRRLAKDGFNELDPAWSPDGAKIAYASDKAGTEDLYVLDVAARTEKRVTSVDGAEFSPAWSPDGSRLAFQDQNFATWAVDVASGALTRLTPPLNASGRPSWSPDGRTLAMAVSSADLNRILLLDVATGATRTVEPAPFASITSRGDDGPIWTPNGLVFTLDGVVQVLPVDATGTPTGPVRQITRESADAPTFGGGSLLYLHNGGLRLSTLDGRARDVPVRLTYTQDRPDTRLVIHAGRLWDGRNAQPRENVDIVVVGNRIRTIEPHRADRPKQGWTFVDASKETVTPGLVDMHNHQEIRAKSFGDRQGRLLLSYGITTTRSTGDPAYRALEDRESLASGARIGPRFFMTGEMLDGSRLGWEFARPVRTHQQLDLELDRARALGYDLIKTYERFPVSWQAEVAQKAHAIGIPTTSHYLYPAVAHGVDMKEHLAGPSKWGFGFAREASYGGVYDDVIQLASRSRMPFSTTMFSASSLLADEPGLVTDPRVRALYTTQDQQALNAKLLCAQGRGPCGFLDGSPAQAKRDVDLVKRLVGAGAIVLAGTDSPLDSTAVSLHLNLRSMAKYGMTPFQALQSATLLPARQLGVEDDLGSVEEGKLADLVITSGNASQDINALANVTSVVKNGRLHTVPDLIGPFA
ncbi:amidohydrolase family protein [Actinosynnema sp. NPDC020468]|uniref:amidohydrolase family protein n=1 Tax=Actinosynnema sp. NPDC020468 TaxID=3154488 RepID=UPI0033C2D33B